jgi:CubicO group peptidase (beta-lactamase class C family)
VTAQDSLITFRDLLTMTSGFSWDEDADYTPWFLLSPDHVQAVLDLPHAAAPGVTYLYNTAAVHLLAAALGHAVHTELHQYATTHLFAPLGISSTSWETLDHGLVNGGAGLAMPARDLLTLGQLMLQNGVSGSQSIVPADWIRQSTAPQFSWRTDYGAAHGVSYAYLWWTADGPPAAFFAWGFGGQLIYVVPSLDLVVVTTTAWIGMSSQTALDTAVRLFGLINLDIVPAAIAPAN